jgi:hypothetical protein
MKSPENSGFQGFSAKFCHVSILVKTCDKAPENWGIVPVAGLRRFSIKTACQALSNEGFLVSSYLLFQVSCLLSYSCSYAGVMFVLSFLPHSLL